MVQKKDIESQCAFLITLGMLSNMFTITFAQYMTSECQFFSLTFKVCSRNRKVHLTAMYIIKILPVYWTYIQKGKKFLKTWHLRRKNADYSIQWNPFYFKEYKVRWKMLIRLAFHNDFSLLLNLWHLLPQLSC